VGTGELSSDDDFYLLDTGLAVLQTTNNILDASLYRLLTPSTLTSWQRVRAANMLSTTGAVSGLQAACRLSS
jgi:Phospholipase B